MIKEILPIKIFHKNINKTDTFHLETTRIAKELLISGEDHNKITAASKVDKALEYIDERYGKKYSSPSKAWGLGSATYGKEHLNPNFKEIFDFINGEIQEFIEMLNVKTDEIEARISSAYLNFSIENKQYDTRTPIHEHEGVFLEFTYYFHLEGQCPSFWMVHPFYCATGKNQLQPYPWSCLKWSNKWIPPNFEIKPKLGDLYIWPGFLNHGLLPINPRQIYRPQSQRLFLNGDIHIYSDDITNYPPINEIY